MKSKTIEAAILVIAVLAITCSGCSKDSNSPSTTGTCSDGIKNQNETGIDCGGVCSPCTTPTGDIKVTVSYTPTQSDGSYIYTLESPGIQVELKDDNYNVLATQYITSTGGTVDFGTNNYATYHISAQCSELKTSVTSGSSTGCTTNCGIV